MQHFGILLPPGKLSGTARPVHNFPSQFIVLVGGGSAQDGISVYHHVFGDQHKDQNSGTNSVSSLLVNNPIQQSSSIMRPALPVSELIENVSLDIGTISIVAYAAIIETSGDILHLRLRLAENGRERIVDLVKPTKVYRSTLAQNIEAKF